ncbi:MAG: hypothetical protein ACRER5_22990 [Pseudomonas sp.]
MPCAPHIVQLFNTKPPLELIEEFVKCLGTTGLQDRRVLVLTDASLERVANMLPRLLPLYIACKAFYLKRPMTAKNAMNVLRQLLRGAGSPYTVHPRERHAAGNSKRMEYFLLPTGARPQQTMSVRWVPCVMSFH